jgi:hypothetical protein
MRALDLLMPGHSLSKEEHRRALALRQALRAFLEAAPAERSQNSDIGKGLETAAAAFPLLLTTAQNRPALSPKGANQLGRVLAELNRLAETAQLDRLKMRSSSECRWFFLIARNRPIAAGARQTAAAIGKRFAPIANVIAATTAKRRPKERVNWQGALNGLNLCRPLKQPLRTAHWPAGSGVLIGGC